MDLFNTQNSNGFLSQPAQQPTDLFSSAPPPAQRAPAHSAYNKNSLSLSLSVQRSAAGAIVTARFTNTSNFERLTGVGLQAAVPKTQKLQLNAVSKSELDGGEEAVQSMKIIAVEGKQLPPKLRLRLKVSYTKDGAGSVVDQVDWSEPA
ncbi:MAG: hypothetical protein Q9204_007769 [Flavoplaca sp. TL-2023a]